MQDPMPVRVVGQHGLTGVLLDPVPRAVRCNPSVRIKLADGRIIQVPAGMLVAEPDGTYRIPVSLADVGEQSQPSDPARQEHVIPVLAEELVVEKRAVQTGGVRVHRHLLEHNEVVELPLLKEHLEVRRVVIDREVDGPLPVRRDGDTTIIPIVEEVLVVEKRYRLKEEVHVTRWVREEFHREVVTLQRQEAEIEEFDADGRTRPIAPPEPHRDREPRRRPRKSTLGDR